MALGAWSVIAILTLEVPAFRVKPKRSHSAPQIDGIFSYATPGISEPALRNPRGGCFPGVRSAVVNHFFFGLQEADLATTVTGVLGFRHPFMDFKELDVEDPSQSYLFRCGSWDDVDDRPWGTPNITLHERGYYSQLMADKDLGYGDLLEVMSNLALPQSYNLDRDSANAAAQGFGWSVIGSAVDAGGQMNYVGEQVSHLFQEPTTKECILTFQGSSSPEDWAANLNIQKRSFCGYSGVHKGFQDALMMIVEDEGWQTDVRPKLSSCSKVYVTGHSLGAAQAELFGACVNQAPQPGQDGYEHYKFIGW